MAGIFPGGGKVPCLVLGDAEQPLPGIKGWEPSLVWGDTELPCNMDWELLRG